MPLPAARLIGRVGGPISASHGLRGRGVGGLPQTLSTHVRRTADDGAAQALVTTPRFLAETWGLESPRGLPRAVVRGSFAACIRMRANVPPVLGSWVTVSSSSTSVVLPIAGGGGPNVVVEVQNFGPGDSVRIDDMQLYDCS